MTRNRQLTVPIQYKWWMIVLLLLVVAVIGIVSLTKYPLWYDEIYSLIYSGGAHYGPISPTQVISRVVGQLQHEKNPPGFYLLLHFWVSLVGSSPVAARYLALLAGILAIAWTYRLGRDAAAWTGMVNTSLVGLGSAVAVGASAFFIFYLHELRAYSFIVLLSAFQVWAYLLLINVRKPPGLLFRLTFVMSLALSLYLHYQSILVFLTIGFYHVVFAAKTRRWWDVLTLFVLGGVIFLPWVWVVYVFSRGGEILRPEAMEFSQVIPSLALTFSNDSAAFFILLVLVVAAYTRTRVVLSLASFAVIGVVFALAVNLVYPYINEIRYIIFLWPMLALVVGLGVERLARFRISPVIVIFTWLLAAAWTTTNVASRSYLNNPVFPWNEFRSELLLHGQPGDALTFHSGDFDWIRGLELDHYVYGLPMNYKMMEYIPGKPENDDYFNNARAFFSGSQRVWVAVSHTDPPNFRLNEFQRALTADGYGQCFSPIDLPTMTLDLYTRLPQTVADAPQQFDSEIGFATMGPIRVSMQHTVTFIQQMVKANTVREDTYSVAVHVEDSQGNLFAQTDFGLPRGTQACFATTVAVPSGSFVVRLVVYDWQTGERLPGVNTDTGEQSDRLAIGAFQSAG